MGLFGKKDKKMKNGSTDISKMSKISKYSKQATILLNQDSRGKVKLTKAMKSIIQVDPGEVQILEEKGKVFFLNKLDLDIIPKEKYSPGILYLTDKYTGEKVVLGFRVTKDAGTMLKQFIPSF